MLKSPIPVPYLITFITEFCVLVLGIYTYRLAGTRMGEQGFAEYALVRRTLAFLQPVVIAGMGVGIPRYVALHFEKEKEKAFRFFVHAIWLALLLTALACFFSILLSNFSMYLVFGSADYAFFAIPISISLLGLVLHSLAYGYYRGCMNMKLANILQVINTGLVPLSAFFFMKSISGIVLFTGCCWTMVSLIFFTVIFRNRFKFKGFEKEKMNELIAYGLPRIPGDVLLALAFSLPSFWVAHLAGVQQAGYVAFGISLLSMTGAFFGPLSLVLLPEAAKKIASQQMTELKNSVKKMAGYTILLTVSGIAVFELFAEYIVQIFFGSENLELTLLCRYFIVASIGYTIYVVLRSVLDAYHKTAVNAINIFISFMVFAVFSFLMIQLQDSFMGIVYGFIISIILLGALSVRSIMKIFQKKNIQV